MEGGVPPIPFHGASCALPSWVPLRGLLVYATAVLEIAIAIGLVIPALGKAAGYAAAAVLVLFFPANVYVAFTHAPTGGHAWTCLFVDPGPAAPQSSLGHPQRTL
jgi:uncharacterized membrane protein